MYVFIYMYVFMSYSLYIMSYSLCDVFENFLVHVSKLKILIPLIFILLPN